MFFRSTTFIKKKDVRSYVSANISLCLNQRIIRNAIAHQKLLAAYEHRLLHAKLIGYVKYCMTKGFSRFAHFLKFACNIRSLFSPNTRNWTVRHKLVLVSPVHTKKIICLPLSHHQKMVHSFTCTRLLNKGIRDNPNVGVWWNKSSFQVTLFDLVKIFI